jgi:hypothetical protein
MEDDRQAHKGAAYFAEYFNIPYVSEKSVDFCLDMGLHPEKISSNLVIMLRIYICVLS